MKPTLVTGANGHLGSNLCRLLLARGEPVRAMMRSTADASPVEQLGATVVRGDIDIIKPSVEGTRNVVEAAAKAGVEKVVYVSTGGTIGHTDDPRLPLDERHEHAHPHTPYLVGKLAAEREAFAIARRERLALTAINPSLVLGPRFAKISESVRQVADFVNRGAPLYFDGGFGIVDVEDVAGGALLAMEKGRDGERYIVGGENLTIKQTFDVLSELTGVRAPTRKLSVPAMRRLALAMELVSRLTGSKPLLDRARVDEFVGKYGFFSSAKAERELGYRHRTARETLRRTVAWLLDHGFVPERRRRALRPHASLAGAY
jgi:dihydroflavonol-4-reductase